MKPEDRITEYRRIRAERIARACIAMPNAAPYAPTYAPTVLLADRKPTRDTRTWTPACPVLDTPTRRVPAYLRHPSRKGTRLSWTPGHATRQRWIVRAYLDTIARERIAVQRAAELIEANAHAASLSRAHLPTVRSRTRAYDRARAAGIIVGYVPTVDGAWSEDTPRDVVNARETRAAERGRGSHRNAPAASKVSMRDAHAPTAILRSLRTVGVATHYGASDADNAYLLSTVLSDPMKATYRVLYAPQGVYVADTARGAALDTAWSVVTPAGPVQYGPVLPVHTEDTEDTEDTPTIHPAHVQAAADHADDIARMAAMGRANPTNE